MNRSRLAKVIALSVVAAAAGAARAGDVDITKNRDSHIRVWNTLLGFRYGDPVYDGTLPSGHRLQLAEGWVTDLSVEQDPVAAAAFNTTTGLAVVTGGPGSYTMPELESGVSALVGDARLAVADLASPVNDIFVTFDLDDYFMGGGHAPPVGTLLNAIAGQIPGMPGVVVGLAEFQFGADQGWTTTALYSGPIEVIGEMGLRVPAPGSMALLVIGSALASARRR